MAELLLELLSEEIPARMQKRATEDLQRLVCEALKAAGLAFAKAQSFATPRRLALVVEGLPERQPDQRDEKKGPRVGSPDQALQGFLKGAGLASIDQAEKRQTDKGEFYFAVIEKKGRASAEVLPEILLAAIAALPWPKSMKWGDGAVNWVRPLQSIIALLDGKALVGEVKLGGTMAAVRFGDSTVGHRFHAPGRFAVKNFADYVAKLRAARVILNPAERRKIIADKAATLAAAEGLTVKDDPGLLDEVAGLVEWPVPLLGQIDAAFMDLPQEVLVTSMRAHQKYFACLDKAGKLAPRFVVVANTETSDGGKQVVAGNEKVLRARLSDAKFFWDQDRKTKLEARVPALKDIVFHAKLGTVADKVARVQTLAGEIAPLVKADPDRARAAALLAKADLTTGMVGEFPELQGVMGRYYAKLEGERDDVADAIAEHYSPLGPGDACPNKPISIAVALADKIDTLVGFWAIDEKPTGSRDPFALRRAALGVIRLVLENRLRINLLDCFDEAAKTLGISGLANDKNARTRLCFELLEFIIERDRVALREKGVRHDVIGASFGSGPRGDLVLLHEKSDALRSFLGTKDGGDLLTAYRRAANIVKQEEKKEKKVYDSAFDVTLLIEVAEKEVTKALNDVEHIALTMLEREDFNGAMSALATLRAPVDRFFESVRVNVDDASTRVNRLRLLVAIQAAMDSVADFSKIEG